MTECACASAISGHSFASVSDALMGIEADAVAAILCGLRELCVRPAVLDLDNLFSRRARRDRRGTHKGKRNGVEFMADVPKLYRVILQVSDLDKGAEFYSTLLGTEGRRIRGGFRHYFDCGEVILALVDPSADDEPAHPNPDNIYFSVKDLESVHTRAKELGCLSTGDVHGEPAGEITKRPWGERSFYAFDPFGNPICFVEESTIFTGR